MIREAYFRLNRLPFFSAVILSLVSPITCANAGGWWNHRSVVAVPTGPSVGTVTGAAPYQIYTGPAVASSAPVQAYSYAPAVTYSAPVANYTYGVSMPMTLVPATAPSTQTNAFSASSPQSSGNTQNDDLVRELASRLRSSAAPAAAAAPSAASNDDLVRELSSRLRSAAPSAAPQQPTYGSAAPAQQAYTPVLVGYTYAAPAVAASAAPQIQAAAAPQQQQQQSGMSLVPVQLYKQKSFLGHDKLRPVSVYPYGAR
ncbi:MAG: hypothetical protein DWI24_05365 [Planctomycetota bacterium]|nr:MAG: hypothetical protein DWI24_05365 [Planctomycetota bacterium]